MVAVQSLTERSPRQVVDHTQNTWLCCKKGNMEIVREKEKKHMELPDMLVWRAIKAVVRQMSLGGGLGDGERHIGEVFFM